MTSPRPVLLALFLASASPAGEPSPSVTYTLTPPGSDVYVVVRNDTSAMASSLGHDHVVYAEHFTGSVTWPVAPGGPCSVELVVPVRSLIVDPPGLREQAGLDPEGAVSDGDKVKIQRNMWGASQLSAEAHSTITFRAPSCPGGAGKVKVDGTLTIRGVSRPVSAVMDVRADGTTFAASGRFETEHTAFGFKPFAATAFGPRNQDRLTFSVSVKGRAP